MEEKELLIDNLKVKYYQTGDNNEIILILHGWGRGAQTWKEVQEILGKNFKTISLDLPGFGNSQEPNEIWGQKEYANLIYNFLEKLNIKEKVNLICHSFGGQVGVTFYNLYPEKVKRLILVSPALLKKNLTLRQKFINFLSKIKNFLPKFIAENNFIKKLVYHLGGANDYYLATNRMKEIFKKITQERETINLEKIKIPTLLIWGKKDKILPLSFAKKIQEKIENSRLEIIENCSHSPHIENPKKLAKIILNFIK